MSNLLVHIGYHRTGTAWLQNYLFSNSVIGFSYPFDRHQITRFLIIPHALDFEPCISRQHMQSEIQEVENRALIPVLSHERFVGNPHSGGYDSKELADRVKAVLPEAKILIVIREQKSMIISTYKQYVNAGGTCSVINYLQPPTHGRTRIPLFDWDHFKYHRLIQYYQYLFGQSQVLVLPYELFREAPFEFVTQIMCFCEIVIDTKSIEKLPYTIKKNKSLSGTSVTLKRNFNHIVGSIDRLNLHVLIPLPARTARKLQAWWQKIDLLIPQSVKNTSEDRLRARVSELIGDKYRQSNTLTATSTHLNLAQYGYDS